MTGRRASDTDDVPALLTAAVRLVAGREGVTVKDVRDGLGCARVDAEQALTDLEALGLVGAAARGRRRPVLFTFLTSPSQRSVSLPGVLGGDDRLPPDDPADDPGATQGVGEYDVNEVLKDAFIMDADLSELRKPDAGASPFSDPVVPPDPFTDSDWNEWPTRDLFGPVDF